MAIFADLTDEAAKERGQMTKLRHGGQGWTRTPANAFRPFGSRLRQKRRLEQILARRRRYRRVTLAAVSFLDDEASIDGKIANMKRGSGKSTDVNASVDTRSI